MRLTLWIILGACLAGCNANSLPLAPTPVTPSPASVAPRDPGNWTPWSFKPWQPGIGTPLAINGEIDGAVDVRELCVEDILDQWGARACTRFVVSTPSEGWLHALLRWDSSAPGFDLSLAGEVVLVAANGRFATSKWQRVETEVFARVEPGTYDILVLSYGADVRLPFHLTTELRP